MGYEFTPEQDIRVRSAANRVMAWGVSSVVLGTGMGMVFLAHAAGANVWMPTSRLVMLFPVMLVMLGAGWFYIRVGLAFRAIASTRGRDISHALAGLGALGNAMRLETVATIIAVITGIGVGLFGPFGGAL